MFYWNARFVYDYLQRVQQAIMAGDDSAAEELPEVHATCAGLKVWSTVWAHANIEECRKACGGQGFLSSSGIVAIATDFAEPVTVEGEQVVLSFQVARFLIKSVRAVKANQPVVGSVKYLTEKRIKGEMNLSSYTAKYETMLQLLKERACSIAYKLEADFDHATKRGLAFDQALNSVAIVAYKSAECHAAYVMALNNYYSLRDYVKDPNIKKVLLKLFELMCLIQIREHAADWIDHLNRNQIDLMLKRINELLSEIRPDAIGLVDAFGFTNIKSTLGRYDGNVYEAIYNTAKQSPLNQNSKMVGWDDFKKVLDMDFLREGMKTQHAKL